MPRILYSCSCDGCHQNIPTPNDENDVAINSAKYVLCRTCFLKFESIWDAFMASLVRGK